MKPKLVDLEELKKLMDEVKLSDEKLNHYINARWLKYVEWWDYRSRDAKRKYQALRIAVIVGGALIPALVGLRELMQLQAYGWMFAVASIVVSLVVAICAGLESFFGYGDIWREKRMAAELLKSEGFGYLELAGGYATFKTHEEAYKLFAQNVEELIRHEIKDYIVAVTPKPPEH
jgi:cation transport ATPase